MNFDDFWPLVENHGSVAYFHRNECEDLWGRLTPEQQLAVYNAIKRKLDSGLFVHFDPTKAVRDNLPQAPKIQILTTDAYYARFGTTENQDGWHRVYLEAERRSVYIKEP